MFKKLAAALASLIVASTVWAPAAMAWSPGEGGYFNNPRGSTAEKFRLQIRITSAIRHTPRGGRIMIATYLLDYGPAADALIAARNRGVSTQVVMDDDIDTRHSRRLQRVLNRDNGRGGLRWGPDNSFAIQCQGSCRGGARNVNLHSKFYAFSRTGTAANVVMVSSANLNRGAATLGWNDLFVMRGVPSVYAKYRQIHEQMARDRGVAKPYQVHRAGRFESRFFPKPSGGRATDPTYQALNRIHCRGASGGAGRGGRTAVNISMFFWAGDRGMYLARKVIQLDRDGCLVSVIYGAPANDVAAVLRKSAWNGGIELYDSRMDRNNNGKVDMRVHHKYMLVNGHYGADRSSWQVFAGSQNWAKGLRGDEVTLKVASRPAYARYLKNWQYVRSTASRKIGR